jgi:hypothetical protein
MRKPPAWVDPLMRVGYTARGVVYLLVGVMTLLAAQAGGRTPDSTSALGALLDKPFGRIMMALVVAGLLCYALWSFIQGSLDLDDKGNDAKGWMIRAAQLISGAIHLSLAVSVALLAIGRSPGGDRTDHWTAILMQQALGRVLVAAVGSIAIGIGVQHFIKAHREKYKAHMRYTPLIARLDPVLKIGLVAHGLVVLMVGTFFIWAAWTADPSRAGGMREALIAVREADPGQTLFAILGAGLLAFGVYCFIVAAYRIVPRCAPANLETWASKARALFVSGRSALRG